MTETRRLVDVVDQVIDPRLVARRFDYDEADRLIAERDEANLAETHYLDAAGLADSTRRRTGLMVGYRYDIAGRLVQTRWAGTYTGLSEADSVRYTLNTAGQITSAVRTGSGTTPGSTVTRSYAPTGELLSESGPTGTMTYGYDAGGRRAWYRVGAPNNTALSDSITYTYNGAGTLARIEARWRNPGGGPIVRDTVDFTWDRAGRRDQLRYSNGAIVKFAYDADGALRLMCSNHTHPLGQPDAFEFTLFNEWIDRDGMIRLARTKGTGLPSGCAISDVTSFTHANVYGARHQLLQQTANTELRKYRYDGSGNMRKSHEALMVKAFQTPTGSNRVATYTIAPTGGAYDTKSVTYLDDGSRSTEGICAAAPCTSHDRQYLYDGLGRTIGTSEYQCVQWFGNGECKVTGPNITATTCLYDALGRTYKACGNGGPILGFDGVNVTRTDSDASAYGWTIVHGPGVDDPLMAFRGQSSLVAFYLTDGGGRQYGVANRNGSDYSSDVAFLEGAGYAGGVSSSEGFGAQRDATPSMRKLSFFRNRVYDQATGRWTQEDPIGVAGGVNLYQFNGNNPIAYSDPFGLCPWCIGAVTGVITGFAIAKLTGSEYTLANAATDATLGAVGVGLASKLGKLRALGRAAGGVDDAARAGRVAVSELRPTHSVSNKAVQRLADDMAENGVREPLRYVEHNGTKYVVDGNHRLQAARRLGLDDVPAERVELPYKGYRTIENVLESAP
jgi:RHS repeat-associated protein